MALQPSCFPDRLRVLLADDDPVSLMITARMLNHCNYHVVEISKATDALKTLEKNPKDFDLMITDVYNDIEILSLLAGIRSISGDLPVVLISGTEDNSTLINCVLHGADDIITKPVALTKIKTLWQHVYRRRMLKKRGRPEAPLEANEAGSSSSSRNDDGDVVDDFGDDHPRKKKMRVRWQGELHEKFTEAVQTLGGLEKAAPKKILELMKVPEISRESVASHLQKCRRQKKPLAGFSSSSLHAILSGYNAPPLIPPTPIVPESLPPLTPSTPIVPESLPPLTPSTPILPESLPPLTPSTPILPESLPPLIPSTPIVPESLPPLIHSTPIVPESLPPLTPSTPILPESLPLLIPSTPILPESLPPLIPSTPILPEPFASVSDEYWLDDAVFDEISFSALDRLDSLD